MKINALVVVLLLFNLYLKAQTITILNQSTNEPLEMASISSQEPMLAVFTNSNGSANISAFTGSSAISFSHIGFLTTTLSFNQLKERKFKIYLATNSFSLDQFVVSANRWEQSQKDVPQHIAIINSQQVVLQNPQTTADLLTSSGEVFVQKSQLGGGSPMIRGFSTNRILIVVDDIRMNNAIFRSGNLQNVISVDPFSLSSTEILFGPGSLTYGSDALGGVMSFKTLKPKLSSDSITAISGNSALRYSSANFEKTGHFDINIGFKKIGFVTSVTYTDFDDLVMGKFGSDDYLRPEYIITENNQDRMVVNSNPRKQVETGYSQINLMQKIRLKPNEKWDINFGFHYSTTSDVPRYDRLTRYTNENLRSAEWYYGPQNWMMNALAISYNGDNALFDFVNINAAFQMFEESRHDRNYQSIEKNNFVEKVYAYSLGIDLDKGISEKNTLFYGAEIVHNRVGSSGEQENIQTGQRSPIASRYPDGSTWSSFAIYLSDQMKLSDRVTLQGGIRYNYILLDATFDTTLFPLPETKASINTGACTGSLGIVYKPAESWQISVHGSSGFRSPNIDDIGKIFESAPGNVLVPNPNLEPEYAWNAEFNISKVIAQAVKLDLSAFYTYLDNALIRRDFQLNGQDSIWYEGELSQVQSVQNAAFATVYGFQAGLEVKLPKSFRLSGRFNYQIGEEELDNGNLAPLRHAAPWFGIAKITYQVEKLRAEFYTLWSGGFSYNQLAPEEQDKAYLYAKDTNGLPYAPGWYTFNIKANYQITKSFIISAGIENIGDSRYRPYSSGITAPGRNYIASLKAAF